MAGDTKAVAGDHAFQERARLRQPTSREPKTITVTAATGHLGRLVVEDLLQRGVPAGQIVAAVRSPDKATGFADRGVRVFEADYIRPETLAAAFAGTDKLLLISPSEVGRRQAQHNNVVQAAVDAGVELIAYISAVNADSSSTKLSEEHRTTEALIRESGLPYVFLRNGWYIENSTENLATAFQFGTIAGSAGDGRISGAARADLAAAAAVVLTGDGHDGAVYELGGTPFTMTELAAEVAAQSGKPVTYQNLPAYAYTEMLLSAGRPAPFAALLVDSDLGISRGDFFSTSTDLERLIGRPSTPLTDVVAAAVKTA
ncbi:SDR family oxidoreductase [Streptomyces stelliscabiei]|uniref:SDR family oxidoreductase n=1 Tax=Streptomyces stelliscabiei TaxID=146820 RepID=UPI003A8D05AE